MAKRQVVIRSAILVMFMTLLSLAHASEPAKPSIDAIFSADKEAKIGALKTLAVKDAIEQLKGVNFFVEKEYLNKAIYVAFMARKQEAINVALDLLKLPRVEYVDNKKIDRSQDIFVAKKILQVFPEDSMIRISAIYNSSDASTKSNLIQALGNMAGIEARNMLIAALDNKAFCEEEEEENPEMEGEPMRVCDVAYNQLVLRYHIQGVLRTIGPAHTLEQRDYHISILRGKL